MQNMEITCKNPGIGDVRGIEGGMQASCSQVGTHSLLSHIGDAHSDK